MLVLSRKIGESIQIGDGVLVTILGLRGRQVRIGITAPREVSIRRNEIEPHHKVDEEQKKETRAFALISE